ncbi:MAG: phosphatase PAP2 family protein [Actinomycetota bacterium]|nr:phosphatase PAP2 family protein [Actinomycetota bacterium]
MDKMVGKGAKEGSNWVGRAGDIAKQPPVWGGVAGTLALTGPRGRQAALRGGVCYLAAALVHLPIKVVADRRRPPGASRLTKVGPLTSSFPSGHCASELAFSLGAAQELPYLFVPLYAATLLAEWSLVRSRSHYPSDVFAGAALAVAVSLVAFKLWPPVRKTKAEGTTEPTEAEAQAA